MGVYIKDMEMPENCRECDPEFAYMVNCKYWTGIESDGCPPVPVKTPHGRLIDADALVDTVMHTNIPSDTKEFIEDLIGIAPTVIEAEEG